VGNGRLADDVDAAEAEGEVGDAAADLDVGAELLDPPGAGRRRHKVRNGMTE